MGGEVTVYSGAGVGAADGGMDDISSKPKPPGMLGKPGMLGICMPRIGGMPPMPPIISCPIIVEELDVDEELEKLEDEDMFDDIEFEPMFIDPIPPIILLIISSIPRLGICIPPMAGMPPIPPMLLIIPPGIGPPEDIIVEDEDEEEEDLKDDIVEPSSDWVVAASCWLLAFSSFFTAVPSSVTKAWL